jgi:TPR repeat protein/dienelactone hydrolase
VRTLGQNDDHPLTDFEDHSVRYYLWEYDSQALLFFKDEGGDEAFKLYRAPLLGEYKNITPPKFDRVLNFMISPQAPDRMLLQMQTKAPTDRFTYYYDNGTYLYEMELHSGQLKPVEHLRGKAWADNALQVRVQGRGGYGTTFEERDSPDSGWESWLKFKVDETFSNIYGFSAANSAAYVGASFSDDRSQLFEVNLKDGTRKVLASDPHADLSDVFMDPTTQAPQAAAFSFRRLRWTALTLAAQHDFDLIGKAHAGDIVGLNCDQKNTRWVFAYRLSDSPPLFCLYDRTLGKVTPLFDSMPDLKPYPLAKMYDIDFKARDGMQLYGYLSLPPGLPSRNLPLLLVVHGGPWSRDHWGFEPEVQWLCNRGYAVLQVNYRGSTGYGRAYLNAGNQEWGRKMSTDLLDAKQWAIQTGYADPERVGIYGASYGGYAALAGLAFSPKEFRCGVDICGPSSLITLFRGLTERFGTNVLSYRVGRSDWQRGMLAERSPLNSAGDIEAPLFIAQGENDPRVPKKESDQMVEALKRRGKEVYYTLFEDEGHGFEKWENQMALNGKLEHFLAAFMGGRSQDAEFGETDGADSTDLYSKNMEVDKAAIAMGKTAALVAMGDRYREGRDVNKSVETALEWYTKAADQGDAQADEDLAEIFGKGEGVPASPQRSLRWLIQGVTAKGAAGGWSEGNLAAAYRYDLYGFGDLAQARHWYQASLEHGNGWSGYELAVMNDQGLGGPIDPAAAMACLTTGAEADDPIANCELARRYLHGIGVSQDNSKARVYFEKAAERDKNSRIYLAYMAEEGIGRWKDQAVANEAYDKDLGKENSWSASPGPSALIALAKSPVILDGSLSSFQVLSPSIISGNNDLHTPYGVVSPPEHLWAAMRLLRDQNFFYLSADVRQGRPPLNKQRPGQSLWNGDSIEFMVSSRSAFLTRSRQQRSPFDYHFTFAPTGAQGQPIFDQAQNLRGIKVFAKPNSQGYTMTMAIPLAELEGLDWKPGGSTRVEMAVNLADAVTGKRTRKAFWHGKNDDAWANPDLWGMAKLE